MKHSDEPPVPDLIELGSRTRSLPAPPTVVWESLTEPRRPGARPWLVLADGEVDPRVLASRRPTSVTWSSLWPDRPGDEIRLRLSPSGYDTLLSFTHLSPDPVPDPPILGHLRRRLNVLFYADLRYSYGQ